MARKKILLTDDEEPVRALVALTIKNHGRYDFLEATDGLQALEVARRELPDLILMDVLMPRCDGFQACSQLKADPLTKHIPVILLTALVQEKDKLRGQQAGADGYFTKPFSPTALLEKIDSVLNRGAP
ncbi:MAG: response regulator [Chloroflexi bacterium]|nr:response regulator [Chloroflexota bacterium]